MSQNRFFVPQGMAIEISNKPKKEPKGFAELIDLLNQAITLSKTENFSEIKNSAYSELLSQIKNNLVKYPQNINFQSHFDVTPLHIAAGSGLFNIVKLMTEFKPNYELTNCFKQTAAARARGFADRNDIAVYLEEMAKQEKEEKLPVFKF